MTAKPETQFDIESLKRGFEQLEVDTVLGLYADDLEQIEMDDATPPKSPRVRRGKEFLGGVIESCSKSGVKLYLDNPVVGEDRAACTITCEFPDGRRVVSNTIFDLKDGKIVRQFDVQARDPQDE